MFVTEGGATSRCHLDMHEKLIPLPSDEEHGIPNPAVAQHRISQLILHFELNTQTSAGRSKTMMMTEVVTSQLQINTPTCDATGNWISQPDHLL